MSTLNQKLADAIRKKANKMDINESIKPSLMRVSGLFNSNTLRAENYMGPDNSLDSNKLQEGLKNLNTAYPESEMKIKNVEDVADTIGAILYTDVDLD